MIVAEVVVLLERCYRKCFLDLYPLHENGLDTIMNTFSEVAEIGLVGQELAGDTFCWPDGDGEISNHYQDQTLALNTGEESEENFIRRACFANRKVMAREFDQWDKIETTSDLITIATSLKYKIDRFREIGVKFEMFKQDYILEAINELWGADLTPIYRLHLYNDDPDSDDLKRNLLDFHESIQ